MTLRADAVLNLIMVAPDVVAALWALGSTSHGADEAAEEGDTAGALALLGAWAPQIPSCIHWTPVADLAGISLRGTCLCSEID